MTGKGGKLYTPGCGPGGRGFKSRRSPQQIQGVRLIGLTPYLFHYSPASNQEIMGNESQLDLEGNGRASYKMGFSVI